ncbi:two-peptide bacteriocin plantaricin EF subunit PlnF, partial [Lactiplantibacillus plantarum]
NYKSAVGPADWVISAVRGFIHG